MSAVWLLGCVGVFLFRTRHWPLVNDPALMHYVVFLMQRGMAPYREISDINLPGAYVPEWISMLLASALHVSDAAMWRVMDAASLLLLAGWAMVRIAKPWSWFAGVWAGALFALYHGRDGIGQSGQRDLWATVLLLWAVSALFQAMRSDRPARRVWHVAGFGLLVGAACTVKPFGAPFMLLVVPLLLWESSVRVRLRLLLWAGLGFVLPLLAMFGFLAHWGAISAFWRVLRVDLPYHASLGDGTVLQLLGASTIASIGKLLVLLLVTVLLADFGVFRARPRDGAGWAGSAERLLLVACVLLGLVSFVAQGKGYPYQRYPYVAFLLLFMAVEFTSAISSSRRPVQAAGAAGLLFGVLFCAPTYLRGAVRAQWSTPVSLGIEEAVRGIASQPVSRLNGLDGKVQCLDVVAGCTDALLHLQLREATGTIYDEFLFPQTPSGWGIPYTGPAPGTPVPLAVQLGRGKFQAELRRNPPQVLILSAWLFPQGPGDYRELTLWPWFDAYVAEHYALVSQRSFPRAENGPLGYRVYARK